MSQSVFIFENRLRDLHGQLSQIKQAVEVEISERMRTDQSQNEMFLNLLLNINHKCSVQNKQIARLYTTCGIKQRRNDCGIIKT